MTDATEMAEYQCPNCERSLQKGEYCPDCTRKAVPKGTAETLLSFPGAATGASSSPPVSRPTAAPAAPTGAPPAGAPGAAATAPSKAAGKEAGTSPGSTSPGKTGEEAGTSPGTAPAPSPPVPPPPPVRVGERSGEVGGVRKVVSVSSVAEGAAVPDGLKTLRATAAPSRVLMKGERELQEHIADGYRFHLVAGVPSAGKTQLLASYEAHRAKQREGTFLNRFRPHDGKVLATAPGSLNCYPIPNRKAMFVDASGEHFKELYPHLRQSGRVSEADVGFLRTLVGHLDGLVLLLDLRLLWEPQGENEQQRKEQAQQVEILTWVLMLLRWLEHDGAFPQNTSQDFSDYVNRQVQALKGKRLSAPVTLLFSRADEAMRLQVPTEDHSWMTGAGTERRLFPPGEQPFFFAYHCLGEMYGALLAHVRHFRIDFAHSLRVSPTGGVIDSHPMGLFPAVEWMLVPRRQRRLTLPTRHLIALQRRLDAWTGRGGRWRRLPDPEKVQR